MVFRHVETRSDGSLAFLFMNPNLTLIVWAEIRCATWSVTDSGDLLLVFDVIPA